MSKEKGNQSEDLKAPRIYLRLAWIRKFNQVILGTSLCLVISLIILTVLLNSTLIFLPDMVLSIMFWLILGLIFALSFTDEPTNLIKPGITLIGNLIFIILIYFIAIFPWFSLLNVFPIAYGISMTLFAGLCLGGILTLITNTYVLYFWYKYKKINPKLFKMYRTGKIKKIMTISLVSLSIPFAIMAIPGVIQVPITIQPQDYQAKFAFWGGYKNISSQVAQQLNDHEATLVMCCYGNVSVSADKQKFIDQMVVYNNSYPQISIILSVAGDPGAFVWDGNTQNVITLAKTLVSIKNDFNLTTITGLAFDIESPWFPYFGYAYDFDVTPNRTRHDNSITLWNEFFTWMDVNAPELELRAINYVESGIDIFDGDYDLHYIRRYSFLDMNANAMDEFAPMSYRGMYMGKKPYGDTMENPWVSYLDGGHYWMYTQLSLMASALDIRFGNHSKMGVYLGITNCTCYNSEAVQYQNGQPAGNGYDNLVRDALIAKHFGVRTITVFLLSTVIENGYSMGGVFDSYGMDFLDRFNDSVNGINSTLPFQIWYKPKFNYLLTFGHLDHFIYDTYSNLDSFLSVVYISLLFVGNGLIALHGWKKIKSKVLKNHSLPNTRFLNRKKVTKLIKSKEKI